MSVGQFLKAARQEQGYSLEDVAQVTHIRLHLLAALEENNFKPFPSPIVVRGLIRNYATFLKLDPLEALTQHDGHGIVPIKGQRVTSNGIEYSTLAMVPRPFPWELVLGAMLFLAVSGVLSYLAYNQLNLNDVVVVAQQPADNPAANITPVNGNSDQLFVLDTPTPLPTNTPTPIPPTPTPTPIVYRGVTLEILVLESSWVQITVDDVRAFEGILQTNEIRQWTGEKRIAIRSGNAGGIEITVNGIKKGPMGPPGLVVDQLWEKVEDSANVTPQPLPTVETLVNITPTPGQ